MQCRDEGGAIAAGAARRAWQRTASLLLLLAIVAVPGRAFPAQAAPASLDLGPAPVPVAPFAPPFARTPLAAPLVLNGGFCEYRSNHFHAGLDLGTGGVVGHPVHAPADGWIERVRASGIGYGRSLYLHTVDGRTVVFAHLDAYAEPLAGFVAAAQESSGQYEQDLWPEAGRFRVTAGDRIAWSGESGAGGPHLHVEVRRGDMAYHPLRAGLAIPDSSSPTLTSVTFEPLDEASYVERSAAPVTVRLTARPDTVHVLGRVRAVVAAKDGVWRGVDRMVPWSIGLHFAGQQVECRFDSISWATDMSESDHVYDSGRVVGEQGIVMWAPGGFRPRVMRASSAPSAEAGTLVVGANDPPRVLRLIARDLGGQVTEREVVIAAPPVAARGPDTTRASGRAVADSTRWFGLARLPESHLRVTFRGAPAGSRGVTIGGSAPAGGRVVIPARPASLGGGEWTAVVDLPRGTDDAVDLSVQGRDGAGRAWSRSTRVAIRQEPSRAGRDDQAIAWSLPASGQFEPGPLLHRWTGAARGAPVELAPRSGVLEVLPGNLRLRKGLRLEWADRSDARVGLFGDDGEGWSWITSPPDSASRRRVGETRHLGRFALFADTIAPRVALRPAPRRVVKAPYNRWRLEARVTELGSGVDSRASWYEVDGRREPAEWDGEGGILRWRPRQRPRPGPHRYQVVVHDRAGNERRVSGRFLLK